MIGDRSEGQSSEMRLLLRICLSLLRALPLLALVTLAADPPAAAATSPWRVVIIRNWDSMYAVNVMREQGLRNALGDKSPRVVEVYPEEIDPLRFPGELEPKLVSLLQAKYRTTSIDLVIASGLEPLQFAVRNRDRIWPGAPIVFNGVIEGTLGDWKRPPKTTGVTMILDVAGTLEVGRALVPTARKVYVLSGNAPFDRMYLDVAMKAIQASHTGLEPQYIVGLSHEETIERIAHVEPNSLVLYLTMLRDGKGQYSGPGATTVTRVAQASPAPVLAATHTLFGRGPIGGSSSRFDLHGEAAGRIARAVLEGADPDSIAVRAEPDPFCQVDWKGLQRWHVAERNVPGRCAIVNEPVPPWRGHEWELAGLIAVIMLQAALLWALALQSSRRRRAEEQLRLRSAQMAQVARVSTMGALTASIAHEINQPMGAILSNAEAARMMLDQGTLDDDKLRAILTDIRDEDLRASSVIRGLRALLARQEYTPVALELNAEVADALRHVSFEAAHRGIRLTPVFGAAIPVVRGDAVQVQQVVINLTLNAMDAVASDAKRPEVRIETRASGDGAEVVVIDQGPGLRPDDAARLFHTPFTTKKEGMGFGLSIVKTIIEMHGGRVSYEPNIPCGAIFRAWMPAIGA
jgi:signal transduction histidine kinase